MLHEEKKQKLALDAEELLATEMNEIRGGGSSIDYELADDEVISCKKCATGNK